MPPGGMNLGLSGVYLFSMVQRGFLAVSSIRLSWGDDAWVGAVEGE